MNEFLGRLREQKAGVGIFLVLILLPVLGFVFWQPAEDTNFDPRTFCPTTELQTHRIVLIDTTDPLESSQRAIALDALEREVADVPPHGRLTIVSLDDKHPFDPRVVISACAPKRKSEGPSENPRLLQLFWVQRFRDPLLAAATASLAGQPQDETPLIESIYGLARRPDFGPGVAHRRLVIISDLLQNTATLFSQYRDGLQFSAFAQRPQAFQTVPDLSGVEVVNHYLDRRAKQCLQGIAQRRFWETYFRRANTTIRFEDWPWTKPDATLEDRCSSDRLTPALHKPRHQRIRHRRHRHTQQRTDAA